MVSHALNRQQVKSPRPKTRASQDGNALPRLETGLRVLRQYAAQHPHSRLWIAAIDRLLQREEVRRG